MAVHRVTLNQPVYAHPVGAVTVLDYVSANDTLEIAEAWARRDYGPTNVHSVTEVHEDTGHWVNGRYVAAAPVVFPFDGDPDPAVALDDNLQPLHEEVA